MNRQNQEVIMMDKLIKENLERVEEGKPLTVSLSVLGGKFKSEYLKKYDLKVGAIGLINHTGNGSFYLWGYCSNCLKRFRYLANRSTYFCNDKCKREFDSKLRGNRIKAGLCVYCGNKFYDKKHVCCEYCREQRSRKSISETMSIKIN